MNLEKLPLQSADGAQINLDMLYQLAPSCFTEARGADGKVRRVVNFDVLRQLLGDAAADTGEEFYQFTWPGKAEARREAARSIRKTLRPVPEDSVDWDTTQNLYIEGDNLEVLKLLQKSYMGKVKMIYIDPPYNTGNDFVYMDNYTQDESTYDKNSGNVDEDGNRLQSRGEVQISNNETTYRKNTESNGRFHSDWCSMIFARLQLARNLLSPDGVIFISMDDSEIENLTKICNEIFGEQNFVEVLKWKKKKQPSFLAKHTAKVMEYILVYAKEWELLEKLSIEGTSDSTKKVINVANPESIRIFKPGVRVKGFAYGTIPAGAYTVRTMTVEYLEDVEVFEGRIVNEIHVRSKFSVSQDTLNKFMDEDLLFITAQKGLRRDVSKEEMGARKSITDLLLSEWGDNQESDREFLEIFPHKYFDFVKPTKLINNLVRCNDNNNQIILDFFSGSGTTAHAVMQLNAEDGGNRKFIMVQLPEITEEDSEARKAGYENICEIGKERIRRAGRKIKEEAGLHGQNLDTGFRVFRVDESNMEDVYFQPGALSQNNLDLLLDNVKPDRSDLDLLFGAMLNWGVQLSLPMSKATIDGRDVYTINEGDLVACFAENITENVIAHIADQSPLRVLFRDSCFKTDADKINIFEQFKQRLGWSDEEAMKNIRVI